MYMYILCSICVFLYLYIFIDIIIYIYYTIYGNTCAYIQIYIYLFICHLFIYCVAGCGRMMKQEIRATAVVSS